MTGRSARERDHRRQGRQRSAGPARTRRRRLHGALIGAIRLVTTREDQIASTLGDAAHLVGFSYGGVVAMLAAARRPGAVRSLTVIEPALWVARGNPDVDRLAAQVFGPYWSGPADPLGFVAEFLPLFCGEQRLPAKLPSELEQGANALMVERPPWDARIPLDELAAAPFPKLVVSCAHSLALEAVCDVLKTRPRGPAGAQGPSGPQGPQGRRGIGGWTFLTAAFDIPRLGTVTKEVNGPAGKRALRGGVTSQTPEVWRFGQADQLATRPGGGRPSGTGDRKRPAPAPSPGDLRRCVLKRVDGGTG